MDFKRYILVSCKEEAIICAGNRKQESVTPHIETVIVPHIFALGCQRAKSSL